MKDETTMFFSKLHNAQKQASNKQQQHKPAQLQSGEERREEN